MSKKSFKRFGKNFKELPMSSEAPMYLFATERVDNYYKKVVIKNKLVLTVCGSGDQVLGAYLMGAKKVIGFDLNKRSKFITLLKIEALKELNYNEFLIFFGDINIKDAFNYNVFKRISKKLDKQTFSFFNNLYKKYNFNGDELIKSDYFRQRTQVVGDIKSNNEYLKNEKNYDMIKKLIKNIKFEFICSNIQDLAFDKEIEGKKFDIINLSNVPNYFVGFLSRSGVKKPFSFFFNNIILKLKEKLNRGGIIFSYSYSPSNYPNDIAEKILIASSLKSMEYMKKLKNLILFKRKLVAFQKELLIK